MIGERRESEERAVEEEVFSWGLTAYYIFHQSE